MTGDTQTADPKQPSAPTLPRRLTSRYAWALSGLFVVLWLLPITYTGSAAKGVPHMPRYLSYLQQCACLFTRASPEWGTYHVQVWREGRSGWVELEPDGYFDMQIFGYRPRIDRTLAQALSGPRTEQATREIAYYIRRRDRQLNPDGPRLRGVRFVRLSNPARELREQEGRFQRPTLAGVPEERRTVFGKVVFNQ